MRTLLPPVAARAYSLELQASIERLLKMEDLVQAPDQHLELVRTLTAEGRLDAVGALLRMLAHYLQTQSGRAVLKDDEKRAQLLGLVGEAPPDLRGEVERLLEP